MVAPSHITRGIALINLENVKNPEHLQLLAEDGNIYHVHTARLSDSNKHRTTNKFLCNQFMQIWKLNTPKIAAIHAPPSIFKELIAAHKIGKSPITNGTVCLGLRSVKEEITFNDLMDDVHYWSYKAYSNPLDFLKLALFDGWIGNNGRKNDSRDLFLLTDKYHKLQLNSRNHALTLGDIPYEYLSKNYRNKAHFSLMQLKIVRKVISMYNFEYLRKNLSKYYNESIKKAIQSLEPIFREIPENYRLSKGEQRKIRDFVSNKDRNDRVFDEFLEILKP